MIKINKKLNRADGGSVAAGSLIDYNTKFVGETMELVFFLRHYISQAAIDSKKEKIASVENFAYVQKYKCTVEEWTALNTQANAGMKTQEFLKEVIDSKIGLGNTEIV